MRGVLPAVSAICLAACMADPGWERRVSAIEATLARAETAGAMRCAPRELALGRAHLGFAVFERERGHHNRAYEHLAMAEPNADAAAYLSPNGRCVPSLESGAASRPPAEQAPDAGDTQTAPADGGTPPRTERADAGAASLPSHDPPPHDPLPTEEGPGGGAAQTATPEAEPPRVAPPRVPDQDQDGVPDHQDECPSVPGDGGAACPSAYGGLVIRDDRLVLLRPMVLGPNGEPDDRTRALLRSIVQALFDRPRMVVEVGAHTDSEGTELENLAESQRRAEHIRELLIAAGGPAARLRARGYGEELPIESNSTVEGRAANERVELLRLESGSGGL